MNDTNTDPNYNMRKLRVQLLRDMAVSVRKCKIRLRAANRRVKSLYAIKRSLKKTDDVEYAEICTLIMIAKVTRNAASKDLRFYLNECTMLRNALRR